MSVNPILSLWSPKDRKLIITPHFWAVILIIVSLTVLYYSWLYWDFRPDWLWKLLVNEFQFRLHGSLFCIPIIYALLIFKWRGRIIMWLISLALVVPLAAYFRSNDISSILTSLFFLCLPIFIMAYITLELSWRDKERKTLAEREEERQAYLAQIFQAQEDERKRLAQELHDDAIHSLLLVANNVQKIPDGGDSKGKEQSKMQKETIRSEILRVSDELRRLTLDLRPGILDNIGLLPALRWLVDRFCQEGDITTKMVVKGEVRKLPRNTEVIMFRIVQEVLNNVRLHSAANEVVVNLEFIDDSVKISVHDNGKGFSPPKRLNSFASKGKLGLIGIQERVRSLNGTLHIKSTPGQGTSVLIKFEV